MKISSIVEKLFKPSKCSKKIFIDNFGFKNRGDQLMIQSVMDQVRDNIPSAQIFVRENVFLENPSYCIANKLYPLAASNSGKKHWSMVKKLTNKLLCDDWIVTPSDIDVVLDCCGYHFTDFWMKDESSFYYYQKYYASFSKPNRKIIFLPQAFGPFNNEWSGRAMQLAYDVADMVYCRDDVSFSMLQSILRDTQKIKIAPDFTCLCEPEKNPSVQLPSKQYVLLIANSNMVKNTDKTIGDQYISFLKEITSFLLDRGETVYLLNHEGMEDEELLKELNKTMPKSMPILTNLDGAEIKAIIKDSKLLISDRFHGLVSGLTQGVPCLCIGWSHKYAELLKEHQCEGNRMDVNDLESAIKSISEALTQPYKYSSKESCEEHLENRVHEMWADVFDVISKA